MSTKIYNGFKIDTFDITEVLQLVRDFQPRVEELAQEQYKKFRDILTKNGSPELKDENDKSSSPFWVWHDLRREMKKTNLRHSIVDTDFDIVIFPHKEHNCFYGIMYCEHESWMNEFLALPKVSEYGYWDNTDPLESCSEKEWDDRGNTWDFVLNGNIPAMCGFTINLADPHGPNLYELARKEKRDDL